MSAVGALMCLLSLSSVAIRSHDRAGQQMPHQSSLPWWAPLWTGISATTGLDTLLTSSLLQSQHSWTADASPEQLALVAASLDWALRNNQS